MTDRPTLFDPPVEPEAEPDAHQARWTEVDEALTATLAPSDPALDAALDASDAAELPPEAGPARGKLLQLLGLAVGARRILEVGTLGGWSTIWMARSLPPDGELVALSPDPRHAAVAQASVDRAGLGDRVDLRVGPTGSTLSALHREGGAPFDLVLVGSADPQGMPTAVDHAVALSRRGTVVVVDGTVRDGVADEAGVDSAALAARRLHEALAADPRVEATAVQTVGRTGWGGFTLVVVV